MVSGPLFTVQRPGTCSPETLQQQNVLSTAKNENIKLVLLLMLTVFKEQLRLITLRSGLIHATDRSNACASALRTLNASV